MKRKATKAQRRPVIADVNRENAYENIRTKIKILQLMCARHSGPRLAGTREEDRKLLALLPSSARQFHDWSTEKMGPNVSPDWPEFTRNAAATVREAPRGELAKSVNVAVAAVAELQGAMNAPPKREQSLASVRRELKIEVSLRSIAEQELKSAFTEVRRLNDKVIRLEAELSSLKEKTAEVIRATRRDQSKNRASSTPPIRPVEWKDQD